MLSITIIVQCLSFNSKFVLTSGTGDANWNIIINISHQKAALGKKKKKKKKREK